MAVLAKKPDSSGPETRRAVESDQLQSLIQASESASRRKYPIRTALVSVSNKAHLDDLARLFSEFRVKAIATGGTYLSLRRLLSATSDKPTEAIEISEFTGYPENLNGRLKTLHPKVQAGILAIKGYHDDALKREDVGAEYVDLVVANLYPFEETAAKGSPFYECIENVDIGGPAMIRAAAKNHVCVTVIVDPSDYSRLAEEMQRNEGATTLEFRRELAEKAFELTARYDAAISRWFRSKPKS